MAELCRISPRLYSTPWEILQNAASFPPIQNLFTKSLHIFYAQANKKNLTFPSINPEQKVLFFTYLKFSQLL